MSLTYFKRYRMELDLVAWLPGVLPEVGPGYRFLPWEPSLLEAHARAKFSSFRDEIDASVFPCFNALAGCHRLMRNITLKGGFLPEVTWLAVYQPVDDRRRYRQWQPVGTIQGVRDQHGHGAVQNLGIVPEHRNQHTGTHLLVRALLGFQRRGLRRVHLQVTAENAGAIRLYQRLGFQRVKTVFKAVEVPCSS